MFNKFSLVIGVIAHLLVLLMLWLWVYNGHNPAYLVFMAYSAYLSLSNMLSRIETRQLQLLEKADSSSSQK